MIQIYDNKPIEVLTDGVDAYFKAQEVFKSLDLQWRNTDTSLRKRGVENAEIRRGINLMPLNSDSIDNKDAVYISEVAMYRLAFRSNKPDAVKFTKWAAEVIKEIRQTGRYEITSPVNMIKHNDNKYQKNNSKKINSKNYIEGGADQTILYNRKNAVLHTGKTPAELKQIGLQRGLKKSECLSGKEVIRKLRPDIAASMSLTDSLVNEANFEHEKAAQISIEFGKPLFRALIEAGMNSNRLIH